MSNKYTEEIEKRAKQVWEVMHREAYNRGMALTREPKYGDGRVIINTVGAFIKGLNKERDWGLDQNQIDLVRRFLKASGNVVVLSKIEQYQFRIFIREEWHDGILVVEPVTKENPSRADKISPHDAGEDREPAPVEYKCGVCGATYPSKPALNGHMAAHRSPKEPKAPNNGDRVFPLSEHQTQILSLLDRCGGYLTDSSGLVTSKIAGILELTSSSISNTMGGLDDRGLIKRHIKGKRTSRVELTPEGKKAVENLDTLRASKEIVRDFIEQERYFAKSNKDTSLYEALATRLGIAEHRALTGVHALKDEGVVDIVRPATEHSDTGYPTAVVLKGHPLPLPEDGVDEVAPIHPDAADAHYHTEETNGKRLQWLTDQVLLDELQRRLATPKVDPKAMTALQQATEILDILNGLVAEVNNGTLSPLQALGDIEAALGLTEGPDTPLQKVRHPRENRS